MKRVASLLCASLALASTGTLRADAPELRAELHCERAAGPGRILCELTTHAPLGKLVWSDALVVRAPTFARPLRSRIVLQLGAAAGPALASAKLALVASEAGEGQLELMARAVVCHDGVTGEWCSPQAVPVVARIEVAPIGNPSP